MLTPTVLAVDIYVHGVNVPRCGTVARAKSWTYWWVDDKHPNGGSVAQYIILPKACA